MIENFSDLQVYAKKLVTTRQLDDLVKTLALEVDKQFFYSKLECIVLMNGAYQLVSDLSKWLTVPSIINFVKISRYQDDKPTGCLSNIHIPLLAKDGRPLLVIDDVFDEGITLYEVVKSLQLNNPERRVYSLVLFNKRKVRGITYKPDFVGSEIEDTYIFGYGMDLSTHWRHLPEVWEVTSPKTK